MSRHGVASRRTCEEIIASGRVMINGKTVLTPGTTLDPTKDRVKVDGRILKNPEKPVYILLYKPRGYLSTVSDPSGRKKATDLIPEVTERVFPVGRLDYDSEGLLLMTNDGALTHRLTHPSHPIPKTYRVRVKGIPESRDIEKLSKGILLDDGMTAPAQIEFIDLKDGNALFEIILHEGKNRQIRRMFEKIGHEVIRLKRTKVGTLSLGDLKAGQYRHLQDSEVRRLKKNDESTVPSSKTQKHK